MPSPTIILLILLAIACAGDALLFRLYTGAEREAATEKQARVEAQAVAEECSKATEKLAADAAARATVAAAAVAAAQQRARASEAKAQGILAQAPEDPTDACKSADLLNQAQIAARKQAQNAR